MKRSHGIRKTTEDHVVDAIVWIFMILVFLITFYPFWYVFITSLSDGYDFMRGGVFLVPRKFTLANYTYFLEQQRWINSIGVSVARTVIGTIGTVLVTSMVSYALARRDLMFRKTYRFLFIMAMYVSGGMIAFYVMLRIYGILNTFAVYILPLLLNLFFIMVGTSFFESIPTSLLESAQLDGASELKTFFRIVIPVSLPFLATLALFSAVGQWNAWIDSAYYVNSDELRTISYRMMSEVNKTLNVNTSGNTATGAQSEASSVTGTTMNATVTMISTLPIMMVYPFLQKYFVQGIMIGAVKE